jgi:hypothetical protein
MQVGENDEQVGYIYAEKGYKKKAEEFAEENWNDYEEELDSEREVVELTGQ